MLTTVKPAFKSKPVPGRIGELVSFPLQRIHIELTNVCNFDCTFCPKQEMTRKYEYMDYERESAASSTRSPNTTWPRRSPST